MEERAHLTWKGGRHLEATIRDHTVQTDKPEAKGGSDKGAMPSELYLASLGSCMAMSILAVAEKRRAEVGSLSVDASCDFDEDGAMTDIQVTVNVESPASRNDWKVIARSAPKHCTVSQLTEPEITEVLVLNDEVRMALGEA